MNIGQLIRNLHQRQAFLTSAQYGHIEILSERLGQSIFFEEEAQLDKFVNSKSDETEQVVLKAFNGKKTLFIATQEYDIILVYDGNNFSISQFWERENKKVESRPIHLEKLKAEILQHFSTVKNQKLAS